MGIRLSLLVILITLGGCHAPPSTSAVTPQATTTAASLPEVTLMTADRHAVSLPQVVQGRPALVNLWATWCRACEREFDALNRLSQQVSSRALVLGVAVGEPHEKIVRFAQRRGLAYMQLVDEDFAFADALGSERIPTSLVVDRHGQLLFRGGELDAATLEAFSQAIRIE